MRCFPHEDEGMGERLQNWLVHCRRGVLFRFLHACEHFGTEGYSTAPITVPWLVARLGSGESIESILASRVERVILDRVWRED
jgi:hypothetical protein